MHGLRAVFLEGRALFDVSKEWKVSVPAVRLGIEARTTGAHGPSRDGGARGARPSALARASGGRLARRSTCQGGARLGTVERGAERRAEGASAGPTFAHEEIQ